MLFGLSMKELTGELYLSTKSGSETGLSLTADTTVLIKYTYQISHLK